MGLTKPLKVPLLRIAFDLDGVLDRPEMAALARFLYAAGVEIHVITVGAPDNETAEATKVMYARKVERLAFLDVPYTTLHVVTGKDREEEGEEKAALLNYYAIPIMVDDSIDFVESMVENSTAMILHLQPGGNKNA